MNATAPNPVTNAAFTDALGRVLGRPTVVPLPRLAVKAGLGEMGDELLLASIRARPRVATDTGFVFQHPHLEDCLKHELGREDEDGEAR